jgi:hypothetical protein
VCNLTRFLHSCKHFVKKLARCIPKLYKRDMSPTQRSLKLLREQGYSVWIVEHWNHFARIRQDLFGCIDLLAIGNGETLAVQTTSRSNVAARQKKIVENEYYLEMVRSGWRVQVHGWGKLKDGWTVKVVELN